MPSALFRLNVNNAELENNAMFDVHHKKNIGKYVIHARNRKWTSNFKWNDYEGDFKLAGRT